VIRVVAVEDVVVVGGSDDSGGWKWQVVVGSFGNGAGVYIRVEYFQQTYLVTMALGCVGYEESYQPPILTPTIVKLLKQN
jgi:hypothetical protein